jgi:hypothetical protein
MTFLSLVGTEFQIEDALVLASSASFPVFLSMSNPSIYVFCSYAPTITGYFYAPNTPQKNVRRAMRAMIAINECLLGSTITPKDDIVDVFPLSFKYYLILI